MNSQPRKILFLAPSLSGGGAQRVLSTLLRHLDRDRFVLHLGLLQRRGPYLEDIPSDVVIHDLNVSRVRFALLRIVRLVWSVKPHAVLSTLSHLNAFLIVFRFLLPRRTRLLVRETTTASVMFLQQNKNNPRIWSWLYRRFYKYADRIVCLSDAMVSDLVSHFAIPPEKIIRIYNPVDIERIHEMANAFDCPYRGAGPYLVAVGRLSPEKGFDILMGAMPSVLARFPDARLTILGEGALLDQLIELARQLGISHRVSFLGFQRNPWPYLKHADLFVLSSRCEGLPNALLEALALGVSVVATNCPGGIVEVAAQYPNIKLVPPENAAALAAALITSLVNIDRFENQQLPTQMADMFGLEQAITRYTFLLSS